MALTNLTTTFTAAQTQPTQTRLTSGSGTYFTPSGASYIRIRMVGGGGGGGGTGTGAGTGTSGGDTTFGSSFLIAGGGQAGFLASLGGTATIGAGAVGVAIQGAASGSNGSVGSAYGASAGGMGAVSPFGGAGKQVTGAAGGNAISNTGSGGGGGGASAIQAAGFSGSAGGYIDAIISSPAASYAYSVGAKGTGGAAGTSGTAGGDGGSGVIIIDEFYGITTSYATQASAALSTTNVKNYITYGNFETNSTTGWSLASSTLSGVTPTSVASAGSAFSSTSGGTTASPNLSMSVAATGQIAGSYSLSLASTAASTQGNMLLSQAYTLDAGDRAKVLGFRVAYSVIAGAANMNFSGTSSNSFAVWIYDVTNAAWIQPAGVYNLVQNSGVGVATGSFQTPANMNQFQIALVNINATSGAYTMFVDDITVGPQFASQGVPASSLQSYSPTLVGFGTPTNVNIQSRRVGDNLHVQGSFTSGTSTATQAQIPLGFNGASANVTSDNSGKIPVSRVVGYWTSSTNNVQGTIIATANQTYVTMGLVSVSTSGLTAANGSAIAFNGQTISFFLEVPIQGWDSNVNVSSDSDTRVISGVFKKIATQAITANVTNISFTSVIGDRAGAWNGTDTYIVPVSGDYCIGTSGLSDVSSGTYSFIAYLNGVSTGQQVGQSITGYGAGQYTILYGLKAGDQITIRSPGSFTVNSNAFLSINRLSGPAVVAASETVAFSYYGVPSGTPSGVQADLIIPSAGKISDTHNAYNATTGVYTIQVSGYYNVYIMTDIIGTYSTNYASNLWIVKNGSTLYGQTYRSPGSPAQESFNLSVAAIPFVAGDQVKANYLAGAVSGTWAGAQFSVIKVK